MIVAPTPPLASLAERLVARAPLPAAAREALVRLPFSILRERGNRTLVAPGDFPAHAYLVLDGLVARVGTTRRDEQQITALFLPGETSGLEGLARLRAGPALQTLSNVILAAIPLDALRRAGQRHPCLAEALWSECMLQSAIAAEWLVNVGRRRSLSRTAHLLCELACRHGGAETPRLRYPLPARQNHLADMLALTAVHLNRTLRMLREEGLASFEDRDLCIRDWPRLASLAGFDATYLS